MGGLLILLIISWEMDGDLGYMGRSTWMIKSPSPDVISVFTLPDLSLFPPARLSSILPVQEQITFGQQKGGRTGPDLRQTSIRVRGNQSATKAQRAFGVSGSKPGCTIWLPAFNEWHLFRPGEWLLQVISRIPETQVCNSSNVLTGWAKGSREVIYRLARHQMDAPLRSIREAPEISQNHPENKLMVPLE
ncbi:MAG: hypothetical protein H6581_30240 [Bacteroidia bacterium]|nr:hypothetical protein [Bacteroidia bacterium]